MYFGDYISFSKMNTRTGKSYKINDNLKDLQEYYDFISVLHIALNYELIVMY